MLIHKRRKRRRSSTLSAVMRGAINDPNSFSDFVIRNLHHSIGAAPNNFQGRCVRHANRHTVGEGDRRIGWHDATCCN